MLNLNAMTSVHVCSKPTDMRKSFNSLASIVMEVMEKDVLTGDLFVFFNKTKTMVKILGWEQSGFAIYYKRLEQGSLHLTLFDTEDISSKELDSSELILILNGVELQNSSQHKRFGIRT